MQVNSLVAILAGQGYCGISLTREVKCRDMTDAPPPTHAQRLAAVVIPAAQRAGYTGHGSQARLARDTGMSESSVSRMLKGQAVPELSFLVSLALAIGMKPRDLLLRAGLISPESLEALSGSEPSQVGSKLTVEDAADQLGITDDVGKMMFQAVVDRLARRQGDADRADDDHGGTAAQI
jgi:transcriptional regulator with XRE-family HTH domain